jgi:alpha-L-fucosidase
MRPVFPEDYTQAHSQQQPPRRTLHLTHPITTLAQYVISAGEPNPTMHITRRQAIALFATAAPALKSAYAQQNQITVTHGPFTGTPQSLQAYRFPAWFNDAKFGIWAHWGPQSSVEYGDWYARNMYIQGSGQYNYHVETYGHPSKFGYKDLVPLFKAARWDPEHLMDLYVKAGAKYFFSMGVHHDNYDMWNSKYQPRWNAAASGPKRDIVGEWAKAARKRNLRFGVSEHLSNSYDWLAPAHLSDSTGPLAGVPYDGSDPAFADLYHDYTGQPADFAKTAQAMGRVAPDRWKLQYFRRIKDLIDQHQPDLLYTDGGIPFDEYGYSTVAEVYNVSAAKHNGKVESVYFSKTAENCAIGTCALDRERGVLDGKPTPASATGTTNAGSPTNLRRKSSTFSSTSSARTATCFSTSPCPTAANSTLPSARS